VQTTKEKHMQGAQHKWGKMGGVKGRSIRIREGGLPRTIYRGRRGLSFNNLEGEKKPNGSRGQTTNRFRLGTKP